MAAIGGANDELSKAFSIMSSSNATRTKFVDNIVKFLKNQSLSGVDIDWEYPKIEDKEKFSLLLRDLKESLKAQGLGLSIAVAPDKWRAKDFYDIKTISKLVDFINLMTYDYHGSWDSNVGHHAQFFPHHEDSGYTKELNVVASVNYWLSNGAPARKLVVGIPTYGNVFVLINQKQNSIGSLVNLNATKETIGSIGYDQYCANKATGWKQYYDTSFQVYYAVKENSWFGFDNVRTVIKKTRFAKANRLGGVMFWSLDTDDRKNACKQGAFPLISSATSELISLNPI